MPVINATLPRSDFSFHAFCRLFALTADLPPFVFVVSQVSFSLHVNVSLFLSRPFGFNDFI